MDRMGQGCPERGQLRELGTSCVQQEPSSALASGPSGEGGGPAVSEGAQHRRADCSSLCCYIRIVMKRSENAPEEGAWGGRREVWAEMLLCGSVSGPSCGEGQAADGQCLSI